MEFDPQEFVGNPSVEELKAAKVTKDQLKYIAANFNIQFTHETKKDHVMALILTHLGEEPRIEPLLEATSLGPEDASLLQDVEEEKRTEPLLEATSMGSKDASLFLEVERVKLQALTMKLKYEERERDERNREREYQLRMQQLEIAEKAREREHELKVLQLQSQSNTTQTSNKIQITKFLPLLPQFSDYDPEVFFTEFEASATHFQLPKEDWTWLIKPKLNGKALSVLDRVENNTDYDVVKKAILAAYSVTTERYRQNFRNMNKATTQTFLEFASEKLRALKKWLKSASVTTYDDLVNLIALEEFKRKIPHSIMLHITDKDETELLKAAEVADLFSLVHRSTSSGDEKTQPIVSAGASVRMDGKPVDNGSKPSVYFSFCKKVGHLIKNCPDSRCKVAKMGTFSKPVASINTNSTLIADPFKPFRSQGTVSLDSDSEEHLLQIMRDTASAQSILLKSALPQVELKYTGEQVYLKDFHQTFPVPLAKVYLDCPLVKGTVTVAVSEDRSLPIPHANFLLANDLAGELVVPLLVTTDSPLPYNPTADMEKDNPNLFPSCAVTRAQSKAVVQMLPQPSTTTPHMSKINLGKVFSEQLLAEAQQDDVTLSRFHTRTVPKDQITQSPSFYYQDKVLMRVFKPRKLSDDATWAELHQIVLPISLREPIMEIAHGELAGHIGISKTYDKLLNDFYWPGLKKDVTSFINSCHTCQVMGKPNTTIPQYPLQPIKVPEEPFQKILIDKTKKGNQYILTVMCPTTRYPEGFPLKNITSKTIVSKLTQLFTTFGIPREIQSDRGTNFTSDLFAAVLYELGITQTLSTAYHPQSQGALERCHQTLKSLLSKFCYEQDQEWDEALPYILFAIREAPNESLGVSPFELLFGRKVRGPLKVVKDRLLNNSTSKLVTLTQYIEKLNSTLEQVRSFARRNLKQAQKAMKEHFDCKAKVRTFSEGDQVLAFIPASGSPLQTRYHGPYTISKRVSDNNYIINTPDRRKSTRLIHINLLKLYKSRPNLAPDTKTNPVCSINISLPDVTTFVTGTDGTKNSNILDNLGDILTHLSPTQAKDITNVLNQYHDVFGDHPKLCNLFTHQIQLHPGTSPLRHPPYRLHPRKRDLMRQEVDYLLQQGLAVPSQSPWASPCLLVPKEDGQMRLCTDYRRVNAVTVPDAYPLPRIDDLIDSVGQSKYITKIDLLKGYYQIPLSENAQQISAFITPFGLFHHKVMPFGMRNAPSTFQRAMDYLLQDLVGVSVYLDGILIFTEHWDQHIIKLKEVLARLQGAQLTIKLAKTTFSRATVTYLGHEVGQGQVRPKKANVSAILEYPVPATRKALRRFLGMAGYYRRFCPNFAAVTVPLTRLTSGAVTYTWTKDCQAAFDQLKKFLAQGPVLIAPDFTKPFALQTDASDHASGAVLLQEVEGILHPIAYHSNKFTVHQKQYSTIEKKLLAIVSAIQKFQCYLQPSQEPLQVFTDHNPLSFLHRSKFSNQRLLRRSLFLQPYNMTITHIKGTDNVIADALSRT